MHTPTRCCIDRDRLILWSREEQLGGEAVVDQLETTTLLRQVRERSTEDLTKLDNTAVDTKSVFIKGMVS